MSLHFSLCRSVIVLSKMPSSGINAGLNAGTSVACKASVPCPVKVPRRKKRYIMPPLPIYPDNYAHA